MLGETWNPCCRRSFLEKDSGDMWRNLERSYVKHMFSEDCKMICLRILVLQTHPQASPTRTIIYHHQCWLQGSEGQSTSLSLKWVSWFLLGPHSRGIYFELSIVQPSQRYERFADLRGWQFEALLKWVLGSEF